MGRTRDAGLIGRADVAPHVLGINFTSTAVERVTREFAAAPEPALIVCSVRRHCWGLGACAVTASYNGPAEEVANHLIGENLWARTDHRWR